MVRKVSRLRVQKTKKTRNPGHNAHRSSPGGVPKHQTQDEEETAIRKIRRYFAVYDIYIYVLKNWSVKMKKKQKSEKEEGGGGEKRRRRRRKKKRRSKTKFNKHEAVMVVGGLRAHQGSSATSVFFTACSRNLRQDCRSVAPIENPKTLNAKP